MGEIGEKKKCGFCGNVFRRKTSNQKYCSFDCRKKANLKQTLKRGRALRAGLEIKNISQEATNNSAWYCKSVNIRIPKLWFKEIVEYEVGKYLRHILVVQRNNRKEIKELRKIVHGVKF